MGSINGFELAAVIRTGIMVSGLPSPMPAHAFPLPAKLRL